MSAMTILTSFATRASRLSRLGFTGDSEMFRHLDATVGLYEGALYKKRKPLFTRLMSKHLGLASCQARFRLDAKFIRVTSFVWRGRHG